MRCVKCHAIIGKGRTHKCSSPEARDNLHKIINQKSLKSKEKIGSAILKGIFEDKGGNKRGGTVLLATGGKKLPVTLSVKVNRPRFSQENLRRLQVLKGDSDRGIKKVAQAVRHVFGRNSVEPGFAASLTERKELLEHLFEVRKFDMKKKMQKPKVCKCGSKCNCIMDKEADKDVDIEGYVEFQVPGVVTSDFDLLVKEIIDLRGYNPGNVQVLCGLDNG